MAQTDMPDALLDNLTAIDGGFSSVKRYTGASGDLLVKRTILDVTCRITQLGLQVSNNSILRICVGFSYFDSMGDLNGQAVNTAILAGTGPLTDADNSRWFIRCCVDIPLGQMNLLINAAETGMVFPLAGKDGLNGSWWAIANTAGNQEFGFHCHVDTKTSRKLQGRESEWLQMALECSVEPTPAAGDDISILINGFHGRQVMQNA